MCHVVYRQWSLNEQLAYPIAEFAHALLQHDRRRTFPDICYRRSFWIGCGGVVLFHLVNGWHAYDDRMIEIPLNWSLGRIWRQLPFFHHAAGYSWQLYNGRIYIAVLGLAYFLSQEISFSMGVSLILLTLVTSLSYWAGYPVGRDDHTYMIFGSFLAAAGVIVYSGRRYFGAVLRRALNRSTGSRDSLSVSSSQDQATLLSGMSTAWFQDQSRISIV